MRADRHRSKPIPKYPALTIGVLSDTHGRLDQQVMDIVRQTDLLLHAGDLDGPQVLQALVEEVDVVAVRGNMDLGGWSQGLAHEEFVQAGDFLIYMVHDLHNISLDPVSADIRLVISGHTHRPAATHQNGVLYLNPGSPSFPRGGHQASMALVGIDGGRFTYRHILF